MKRGPKAFAYVKIGSNLDESAALWKTYKGPVIDIPPLTEPNWRYQSPVHSEQLHPRLLRSRCGGLRDRVIARPGEAGS